MSIPSIPFRNTSSLSTFSQPIAYYCSIAELDRLLDLALLASRQYERLASASKMRTRQMLLVGRELQDLVFSIKSQLAPRKMS